MERKNLDALLLLARIEPIAIHKIENKYWSDNEHYEAVRRANPWWLVLTKAGPLVIGWRKRVISISWEDTAIRTVITEDDVTKNETLVHAWSYAKAVEYLDRLRPRLNTAPALEESAS